MPQPERLGRETDVTSAYESLGIGTHRTHAVQFYEDERRERRTRVRRPRVGARALACHGAARRGRRGQRHRHPAGKAELVFQPFVQLASIGPTPRQGIGLGLSISRTLAHRTGGDLTAANAPAGGTVLTLTLPRD